VCRAALSRDPRGTLRSTGAPRLPASTGACPMRCRLYGPSVVFLISFGQPSPPTPRSRDLQGSEIISGSWRKKLFHIHWPARGCRAAPGEEPGMSNTLCTIRAVGAFVKGFGGPSTAPVTSGRLRFGDHCGFWAIARLRQPVGGLSRRVLGGRLGPLERGTSKIRRLFRVTYICNTS